MEDTRTPEEMSLRELREEDIEALLREDPAMNSAEEVLAYSAGVRAIWEYRRFHRMWLEGDKLGALRRAQACRNRYAIEIHPGATIGRRLSIDHGMGIVIGETAVLGNDCKLYHGVTLGGTGKETGKRHPTLGDNVMVGARATVLGSVTIGDNVKIGAGAVVLNDVPANTTAVGIPVRIIYHNR